MNVIAVVGVACTAVTGGLVWECFRLVRRARIYARQAEDAARRARVAADDAARRSRQRRADRAERSVIAA